MGHNTTIVVLNDAVHNLTDDPQFARNLQLGILKAGAHNPERPIDVPILNHVNAVQVVACAHADQLQVLAVGGNSGHVMGAGHWSNSDHRLLRTLAAMHGFRLVRDPNIKPAMNFHRIECRDCELDAPFGTCLDCKAPLSKDYRCPNNKDLTHRK